MSKEKHTDNCPELNDCGKSCKQESVDTTEGDYRYIVCEKNENVKKSSNGTRKQHKL